MRRLRLLLALFSLPVLSLAQSPANGSALVNIASGTTQIIAASTSASQIRLYAINLAVTGGSAATFSFVAGTGSNCATSQVALPILFTAQTYAWDWGGAIKAPFGDNVCITTTAALTGGVSYSQ